MRPHWMIPLTAAALIATACGGGDTTAAEAPQPTEQTATAAPETDDAEAPETDDAETPATDDSPAAETDGPQADDADDAEAAAETTVAVASSDLGDILVDGEGRTLYLFTPDEQSAPTCYDGCAQNWPPLPGPAAAGEDADSSLLGVAERDDGTSQVTYNGWPLYHFAGDAQPGDVNGQGVGDVWFAVTPAGEPVEQSPGS